MIRSKKAVMSISIVLLVVAIFVLVILSLFVFNSRQTNTVNTLTSPTELEEAYARAKILDFYLREISSKIVLGSDSLVQFRKELNNYKSADGKWLNDDFVQIERQLNEVPNNHVKIENNLLNVNFKIEILDIIYSEDVSKGRLYDLLYSYNFEYIKKLSA